MAAGDQYLKIRRSLERKLGVEEASYLMDRPAGGWSELVTNQTLDLKLDALRHELRSEMHDMRAELKSDIQDLRIELHRTIRQQTWALMTTLVAALTVFAAIFGLLART